MLKRSKQLPSTPRTQPETLQGWKQIAAFLGQPISVAQRWVSTGVPVKREGSFVSTTVEELNKWLGPEAGEPVHVATPETDLSSELKRGLSYVRQREKSTSNQEAQRKRRNK